MKRIKIAQIGLGHDHAQNMLVSLTKQSDIFEFAGLAMPENEASDFAADAEKYPDVRRMTVGEIFAIPGLDAVAVETEDEKLAKYALLAARHGKHIFMDKPGGFDHELFKRLVRTAKEKKLVFQTGYMYRFNPAVKDIFERVKRGELGEIYSVEAHMSCMHSPEKRQWLEKFPGGMMCFLGCHLIDLIVQLQGVPEEIVPFNTCTGIDGVTATDFGMAVLKYKNGASFVKVCACEPGGYYRRQLVVCGSKGTVELKPFEAAVEGAGSLKYTEICEVDGKDAVASCWSDTRRFSRTEDFDRYDGMLSTFAATVRGEMQNPYTYEYEEKLHRILLAACGEKTD